MSEVIIFPYSKISYRGPFTHPEIKEMQDELDMTGILCSKVQKDLENMQTCMSHQARWLVIRHIEFALNMAKYVGDPELISRLEHAAEKSQYESTA